MAEWSHLIALTLGGGVAGSVVALYKLPKERDQIIVAAARQVVVIQRETLDDMRRDFAALEEKLEAQSEKSQKALEECHAERDELREARHIMQLRLTALEREVEVLRKQVRRPPGSRSRKTDPK